MCTIPGVIKKCSEYCCLTPSSIIAANFYTEFEVYSLNNMICFNMLGQSVCFTIRSVFKVGPKSQFVNSVLT